jgi:hypothetical protein
VAELARNFQHVIKGHRILIIQDVDVGAGSWKQSKGF